MLANAKQWHQAISPSSLATRTHLNEIHHLQHLLLLCAQCTELSFSQPSDNQARIDGWAELYTQLQAWKQNFQSEATITALLTSPIGSMSSYNASASRTGTPISFPIHIFTSRLSFYCAFLDHLTCLLLIQSRPRQINDTAEKSLKTAPWRAVQLCGLSLSNAVLWSWDPVVVAALIFAGSLLTYAGQQTELSEHLQKLEKMTGWVLKQDIEKLEEFWKVSY